MDFFERIKESKVSEMSREEISRIQEEVRVVVEQMAANGEKITVRAVHQKTGIHEFIVEHLSVFQVAGLKQLMKPLVERTEEFNRNSLRRIKEKRKLHSNPSMEIKKKPK